MNREVTEAIEFLEWLLEGLTKFYPDHPLLSRIDVAKVSKGEDKWVGEDARGILELARRSLGLPESTPLDQVISRLQTLVENPAAVSSLPDPVLARLREEEQEVVSRDSPQEKKAKLETISRRPSRAKYEPKAPPAAGPSPKVPTPPTPRAPAEAVGFVDIQAPADVSTLKGATEKAFIDEVVQTIRRERPEIEEGASLEQLRETATEVVRQMGAEGKGGASYKINTTAFSRAISDRGRLAEVLVAAPVATEAPTPPAEKKAVYLAPEAPLPTVSPEIQESVSGLISQVKANKETFVRDLGQKIEEARPEFSKQQAQEAAEHIATRFEAYEPGKISEEAAFASVALNPELFERVFPEPEVRGRILDEAVKVSSQRQQEEQIAKQVLPTFIPEAKEAVVDTLYQPTKQRFVPTPEEAPGLVYFEPQTIIERVEKAPQTGFDLAGVIQSSSTVSQPPTVAPQKTLEFLSPSSATAVFEAPAVKEQVFVGVAEKFAPEVEPEVRARVENLAKSAAANPEEFQSQLKGKLIDSSEFSSNFTSPEQTAAAADAYSKDLTQRLTSLDKGILGSPSLTEIASSTESLDKAFAGPIEKQAFVSTVSEHGAQVGQMAPLMASALGIEEGVIKAAYQPRPLTVSDSPQEGLATVATKNLLPAAEGRVSFSEAIIPPAVSVPAEGKLLWAKAEGPAQELGVKISYIEAPEVFPPKISDLMTTVQKEGFSFNQQDSQDALPLFVFASGVSSAQFQGLISQAQDKGLGKETVSHLEEFLMRLKALEETRPALFAEFQKLYPPGSIELSFVEYTEAPGAFAFVPSDGSYALGTPGFAGPIQLNPGGLVSKGLDKLFSPAKKKIAETLGKTAAGKAAGAGLKALLSQGISKITAAIGTAIGGPVGAAIGALVGKVLGWIATKVIGGIASFLKKHWKEALGGALLLAGILGASPILAVVGGGTLLASAAGLGAGGAGLGAFLGTTIAGIMGVILPALAGPFIIALLSIPLIVALILFIINSGAYLVPPSPSFFAESPYIRVEKTVAVASTNAPCEDPGPEGGEPDSSVVCENNSLPLVIDYTITVTATRGTLTNVVFGHECRVIQEDGTEDCDNPLPSPVPVIISPVTPYVFTYSETYSGAGYQDALVQNTFTVTANTDEVVGARSSGSASVIIGEPPTGCFAFEPTNSQYLPQFQAAAAEVSSHTSYATKLCLAGTISVRLDTSGPVFGGACAGISGSSRMFFNNCRNFQTDGQAYITYLFAHESGHIYQWRSNDFSVFQRNGVATENWLPTYCLNQSDEEDFAETIGDFVDNGRLGSICRREDQRPFRLCESAFGMHCQFARDVIFNE